MPTVYMRNAANDAWVPFGWGEDDGSGEGLPDLRNEPYVVMGASGVLTAERVLTAGSGITIVDGGGTVTISAGGATPFADLPFIMLAPGPIPELTFERYLAAAAGLTLVDSGFGAALTITPAWGTPASPSVNLAASVIGTAASFAHSDHTHQLDQAIVPTWAGIHTFNANIVLADGVTVGQAAGPLLTFDDTGNILGITGCKVGIGDTTPTARLDVKGDGTDASVFQIGGTATTQGANISPTLTGSGVLQVIRAVGLLNPTAAITTCYALNNNVNVTAGYTITNLYGQLLRPSLLAGHSGVITNYTAAHAANPVNNGTGSITNFYGFRVAPITVPTGNIYAYHAAIASAANRWNLYMSGTAPNYLKGNLGIGTTIPGAQLHVQTSGAAVKGVIVRATAAQSANLQEWQDSASVVLAYVEPDGEIVILGDSKALKLGGGPDMSVFYDGADGNIKTDVVAPSDLLVECGAAKTLELQTSVTEDLFMPLAGAKVPAVNAPSWVAFSTNLGSYTFAIDDYADLAATEVLHGYEEGTDLDVHVHFITDGANDATARKVKYQVFFSWGDINEVMSGEASVTGEADIAAAEADRMHHYLALGTLTGTNYRITSLLKTRIKRIAGTGVEPANDPFVEMVGVHYKINTLGSRQELVK